MKQVNSVDRVCLIISCSSKEENSAQEESDVTEADEEHCGMLEAQVQRLCGVVRENIVQFAKDPYGSHVLRTLVQVLSGCLPRESPGAQKGQNPHEMLRVSALVSQALLWSASPVFESVLFQILI